LLGQPLWRELAHEAKNRARTAITIAETAILFMKGILGVYNANLSPKLYLHSQFFLFKAAAGHIRAVLCRESVNFTAKSEKKAKTPT
jgi:hypothetical protein